MKREKIHNQRSKFRGLLAAGIAAACVLFNSKPANAQSITSITPDGSHQFQYAPQLSFVASTGATAITNVTVQLTRTLLGGSPFLRTLTLGNGLSGSGPTNNQTVVANLTSNAQYAANIVITDSNGASATNTAKFDTVIPAYTFEAEDFDYTSNGISGLFFDNPQTNAYAGKASTSGVDYQNSNGNPGYRPLGLATEGCSDVTRLQYNGTGFSDYDVGFTDGSDFGNYTRDYPVGTFNVYMRAASPSSQVADTADLSGAVTGRFSVPNTGGFQTYTWVPLKDSNGNNVIWTNNTATPQSIKATSANGNYNINYYMLTVPNTNIVTSSVLITNVNPDGSVQFQATNNFVFEAVSPNNIALSDMTVIIGATNLAGVGTSQTLVGGVGLSVTGTSTDRLASIPLASNTVYTVFIQVIDSNGNPATKSLAFDTITPAYTFEAEDWDFGTDQFIPNAAVDAYANAPTNSTSINVDYNYNGGTGGGSYRAGIGNEPCGDIARLFENSQQVNGAQDYDLGNTQNGQWANYTRSYPAGIYNIYARVARGDGGNVTAAGSVAAVVSGAGTTSQTLTQIGKYNVNSTGNWQKYYFAPVLDAGNNLARFTAIGGSNQTLRVTLDNAGHNLNYVMLIPADLSLTPAPFVTGFTPDGSALFQPSNQLSFVANSAAGIQQTGVVVSLDGTTVSGLSFSGSTAAWNVTYPVTPNALHTAIITLTDAAGTSKSTNVFATFSSTNYQWEAEDWDYTSGQFFDNLVDGYTNLAGVSGVDFVESDVNAAGRGFIYRTNQSGGFPTAVAGDAARAQFGPGQVDWNIGSFGINSWANYTRHYPAGTYNVWGRFAEGAGPTSALLGEVTSGYQSSSQTTNLFGIFSIANLGWGTWQWAELLDGSSNPVKVTLTGSGITTLQLGGNNNNEVNVNFLMLTPTTAATPHPTITATLNGNNINLSFPTVTGFSYQAEYKVNLTDATWTPIGSSLSGNNLTQSAQDTAIGAGGTHRFYHVKVQ